MPSYFRRIYNYVCKAISETKGIGCCQSQNRQAIGCRSAMKITSSALRPRSSSPSPDPYHCASDSPDPPIVELSSRLRQEGTPFQKQRLNAVVTVDVPENDAGVIAVRLPTVFTANIITDFDMYQLKVYVLLANSVSQATSSASCRCAQKLLPRGIPAIFKSKIPISKGLPPLYACETPMCKITREKRRKLCSRSTVPRRLRFVCVTQRGKYPSYRRYTPTFLSHRISLRDRRTSRGNRTSVESEKVRLEAFSTQLGHHGECCFGAAVRRRRRSRHLSGKPGDLLLALT